MVSKADSSLIIRDTLCMSDIWIVRDTRYLISALLILILALVVGCVGPSNPPVIDRSPEFFDQQPLKYVVKPKDSL